MTGAAVKALPELESAVAEAQQQWHDVGEPKAVWLSDAIRDARREVTRVESEQLTARLNRLQQPSPEHVLGQMGSL